MKTSIKEPTLQKLAEQCISFSKDKYVAAVCSAPSILANLGLVNKATVHPDFKNYMNEIEVLGESVVTDGNIITGQGLASMIPFSLKLVEILVDKDKADKIADSICYRK